MKVWRTKRNKNMGYQCSYCGAWVYSYQVHMCAYPYMPTQPYPIMPTLQPVKCDICGSTAIDHTEMQCQVNRVLKKPKRKLK